MNENNLYYNYFLLSKHGLDFLVEALSEQDALDYVYNILQAAKQRDEIVCCLPAHEISSYFEAVH